MTRIDISKFFVSSAFNTSVFLLSLQNKMNGSDSLIITRDKIVLEFYDHIELPLFSFNTMDFDNEE